jgi:hypothetical protein
MLGLLIVVGNVVLIPVALLWDIVFLCIGYKPIRAQKHVVVQPSEYTTVAWCVLNGQL